MLTDNDREQISGHLENVYEEGEWETGRDLKEKM